MVVAMCNILIFNCTTSTCICKLNEMSSKPTPETNNVQLRASQFKDKKITKFKYHNL